MPKHIQASCFRPNTCGGTCEGCCLAVCKVCGGYEGSLTTDCCGEKLSFDKQEEIYTTRLDYSDEKGWHQREVTNPDWPWPGANFEDKQAL